MARGSHTGIPWPYIGGQNEVFDLEEGAALVRPTPCSQIDASIALRRNLVGMLKVELMVYLP